MPAHAYSWLVSPSLTLLTSFVVFGGVFSFSFFLFRGKMLRWEKVMLQKMMQKGFLCSFCCFDMLHCPYSFFIHGCACSILCDTIFPLCGDFLYFVPA